MSLWAGGGGALIAESEQVLCPAAVLIIGKGSLLTARCQGQGKKKLSEITEYRANRNTKKERL